MYRHHQYTEGNQHSESICHVFDGDVYKKLAEREVEVEGNKIGVKYSRIKEICLRPLPRMGLVLTTIVPPHVGL